MYQNKIKNYEFKNFHEALKGNYISLYFNISLINFIDNETSSMTKTRQIYS